MMPWYMELVVTVVGLYAIAAWDYYWISPDSVYRRPKQWWMERRRNRKTRR